MNSSGAGTFPRGPSFLSGGEPLVALTAPALVAAVALRRGQLQGPTTDQEIEDFGVQHKRIKRDVGEIAWALPIVQDVQNNLAIASRRRSRGNAREGEAASVPSRKQN